jgi:hypothetical protein
MSSLTTATWIWLLAPMIVVLALSVWTYLKQRPKGDS